MENPNFKWRGSINHNPERIKFSADYFRNSELIKSFNTDHLKGLLDRVLEQLSTHQYNVFVYTYYYNSDVDLISSRMNITPDEVFLIQKSNLSKVALYCFKSAGERFTSCYDELATILGAYKPQQ